MRRAAILASALVAALCLAGGASAGPGLLLGVSDDALQWSADAGQSGALLRGLGVRAVRLTTRWQPGQTRLEAAQAARLDRAMAGARGLRVVVAVFGRAADAPADDASRAAYCATVRDLLARYPQVNDVVIWNEPNRSQFWQPQFTPDGDDAAPAAYAALLARCWDVLHAFRPGVNVISVSSPHGGDGSHAPGAFWRAAGRAYRDSGRQRPLFDTFGHHAYPDSSDEKPWVVHNGPSLDQGDYARLMAVLTAAFDDTAQPLPGEVKVTIWYLEDGFQTATPPARAGAYSGAETDRNAISAADQAAQVTAAIRLAYCQPAVGAFFNFMLADERDLGGWQSGLLWADGVPKPAAGAFERAATRAFWGAFDCTDATPGG